MSLKPSITGTKTNISFIYLIIIFSPKIFAHELLIKLLLLNYEVKDSARIVVIVYENSVRQNIIWIVRKTINYIRLTFLLYQNSIRRPWLLQRYIRETIQLTHACI